MFENHVKWTSVQTMLGVSPLVTVGAAVRELVSFGYTCFYMHTKGLIPFPSRGTPAGDAARPAAACHEGLPFCARWRVYDRQFWSNVFCAAPTEAGIMDWLQDAIVPPMTTRAELLATFVK